MHSALSPGAARTLPLAIAATLVALALPAAPALAQVLRGSLHQVAFTGPVTGRTVNFNIYLPEGYGSSAPRRYPVVYHLHGLGGSQGGQQNTTVPAAFEAALDAGLIGPVIVVFPNGYTDSWWADSFDGAKPAETDVVRQVIPYVDAHYRTVPTGAARAVEGFSMGGFGATKFYSKFPELFACCVEYDGAINTWEIMLQFNPASAAAIFNNDEAYFDLFSPWHWTTVNAALLREKPPVKMAVGVLLGGNRNFRDHLLGLGIGVEYSETGCQHQLPCLVQAEGQDAAALIGASLDLACPADFGGDGVVNSQDFFEYLAAFFAGEPGADFNGDGAIDSQDFFDYLGAFLGGC